MTEALSALLERVEVLTEALADLEAAATEVQRRGAIAGSHWLRLGSPLIKARSALIALSPTERDARALAGDLP